MLGFSHNKKQVVFYNYNSSSACNVIIRVPQGTVLGPILF